MTGKIETNSPLRYGGQLIIQALARLYAFLFAGREYAPGAREKGLPRRKRSEFNIPQSPDTAVWYNDAMREAGQRRGF